jgi:hypothetical protein
MTLPFKDADPRILVELFLLKQGWQLRCSPRSVAPPTKGEVDLRAARSNFSVMRTDVAYTVSLCQEQGLVPLEQETIVASNDRDSARKAEEWFEAVDLSIDEGMWLVVKKGARGIHSRKLGKPL